jgi:hypothetical protein
MSYYSDQVIRDGAFAYWRLGETSGTMTADVVGGLGNGTITGGVTLNESGALADGDAAMSFNGVDGRVDTASYTFPTTFSVEAWIKPVGPLGGQASVVNNYTGASARVYLGRITNQLFLFIPGATPSSVQAGTLVAGVWQHAVYVVTPTDTSLYLNGVLVGTNAQTKPAQAAGVLRIGGRGDAAEFWNGGIDEVSLYHLALTPTQILTHYNLARLEQFPTGSYPDRVIRDGASAYWRLGETSGTTAVDVIGGFNGTISGGVTLNQSGALGDGDKAMVFDGTSNGVINVGSLALSAIYTIEAWFKTTWVAEQKAYLANYAGGSSNTAYFGIDNTRLFVYIQGATPASYYSTLTGLNDNQWHHVAIISTATELRVYHQGILLNTVAQTKLASAASTLLIGGSAGLSQYFPGTIDEVAIYPTALTVQQIANHYGLSKFDTPFGRSISAGVMTNLVQSEIYALSSGIRHVTSSAAIEVSSDGVTFSPLTGAETTGATTGSRYIRTLSPTCVLVGKG